MAFGDRKTQALLIVSFQHHAPDDLPGSPSYVMRTEMVKNKNYTSHLLWSIYQNCFHFVNRFIVGFRIYIGIAGEVVVAARSVPLRFLESNESQREKTCESPSSWNTLNKRARRSTIAPIKSPLSVVSTIIGHCLCNGTTNSNHYTVPSNAAKQFIEIQGIRYIGLAGCHGRAYTQRTSLRYPRSFQVENGPIIVHWVYCRSATTTRRRQAAAAADMTPP